MSDVALHISLQYEKPLFTDIICPKCACYMKKGQAIFGMNPFFFSEGEQVLRLADCLKCTGCGNSERLPDYVAHYVVPGELRPVDYG
jgi:hypothetical protein